VIFLAKVFFPKDYILVPSKSAKHPLNTEYKVSIGVEDWEGTHIDVLKIQMVYDGKVAGRRSPSYPIDTDDYVRVHEAMLTLKKRHGLE
jgi:hypothetical protein